MLFMFPWPHLALDKCVVDQAEGLHVRSIKLNDDGSVRCRLKPGDGGRTYNLEPEWLRKQA